MKTSTKLTLLASLYLAQGLPFGFFTQALPVLMREQGTSLPIIGMSSLLALPWALKFLWAPLVDRHSFATIGRRRSWILPIQFIHLLFLGLLSWWVNQPSLLFLCMIFLATNTLAATQDVATDGLAVDLLSPRERGWGNGIQVAGYRVGMILGGGPLLLIFTAWGGGWTWTFGGMAILLGLTTLPILLYNEPRHSSPSTSSSKETANLEQVATLEKTITPEQTESSTSSASWFAFLQRPAMKSWLFVLFFYKAGDALASGMLRPFLVDLGLSLQEVAWMLGTVGFSTGLVGALVGGWGVTILGRRRSLLAFGILQTIAVGLYILPAMGLKTMSLLYVLCGLEHFTGGMATAALFTAMMDVCHSQTEAADYTLQASLVVIATGGASALSGFFAASLGYPGHFALSGLLCSGGLVLLWLWSQRNHLHFDPLKRKNQLEEEFLIGGK